METDFLIIKEPMSILEVGLNKGETGRPLGVIIKISILQDQGFIVQSGSYIASTSGIDVDTQWQGLKKGLFGSELFMLKVKSS